MNNNWGGRRKGSGRKRIADNMRHKGYTFQLTSDELDFIDNFEGNNRSERLRNLISDYRNLKKQIDNSNSE